MTNNENKAAWIRAALAALALILVAGAVLVSRPVPEATQSTEEVATPGKSAEKEKIDEFQPKLESVLDQLALQRDVDQSLKDELASGSYSFEQPLVVVNPYEISPLTAVVVFTTPEPVCISVHVPGVDSLSDVDFSFDEYSTDHVVPIYGLYAGTVNHVTLTAISKEGAERSSTIDIETESMPEKIDNVILLADVVQPEKYQPGLNFMYERKAAFDANGAFRWYLNGNYKMSANYEYTNGHFLVVVGVNIENAKPVLFLEINPLGKIFRVMYAPLLWHRIDPPI